MQANFLHLNTWPNLWRYSRNLRKELTDLSHSLTIHVNFDNGKDTLNSTVTCAGCSSFGNDKLEKLTSQMALETAPINQTSCGNHGICSHQILQDECPGPKRKPDEKIIGRKVSLGQRVSLHLLSASVHMKFECSFRFLFRFFSLGCVRFWVCSTLLG